MPASPPPLAFLPILKGRNMTHEANQKWKLEYLTEEELELLEIIS